MCAQVTVKNPKPGGADDELKKFTFDRVFDWNCTQRQLYEVISHNL